MKTFTAHFYRNSSSEVWSALKSNERGAMSRLLVKEAFQPKSLAQARKRARAFAKQNNLSFAGINEQ